MSYLFKRKDRSSYSNQEKLELAELVEKLKEEYDLEVEKNKGKTKYDYKRKCHVPIKPSTGFIAKAVRQFYADLKHAKNIEVDFVRAVKLASRSYSEIDSIRDPSSGPPKKVRAQGAGRKRKALKSLA